MDGHWRTISVALVANTSGYMAGMTKASGASKVMARDVKAAERQVQSFEQRAGTFGRKMSVGVTLPLAAAAAAAYKFSTDFGRTFQQAQGLAGVAASEVAGLRKEVLNLAGQTGQAPQLLAEGLYEIRSSGLSGRAAMEALTASAQAAAVGLGETRVVADAITSAMNAYGQENLDAAKATDVLIAAVREGKGEPREMAGQFGRLLPIASELGISFDEVGGGLAYLTRSSGDAAQSSTQLLGVMSKILRPTQQARDVLASVGLSAEEVQRSVEEDGLLAALQMLEDRFGGNRQAMTLMFDDVEALNGVLSLLRNEGSDAAAVMDSVAESGGSLREAFEGWEQSDIADAEKALADLQATAIEVGSELAPIVADIASGVGNIANAFRALPDPAQKTLIILAGLAAVAGPVSSVAAGVARIAGAMRGAQAGISGWLATAGKAGPIAGAAAIGIGVLVNEFVRARNQAAKAEAAIDNLASAAQSAGKTTEQVFREQLARSWAGFDDGLDVRNLNDSIDLFKELGIEVDALGAGLGGTTEEYAALKQAIRDAALDNEGFEDLAPAIESLDEMRNLSREAARQQRELDKTNEDLGVGAEDTAESIDVTTESLIGASEDALAAAEAHEEALQAEADAASGAADAYLAMADVVSGLGSLDLRENLTPPEGLDGSELEAYWEEHELTGEKIGEWYEDQAADALQFSADVRTALEQGYDAGLIADLLQQGPEQAGPILRTMVADHTETLEGQVNSSTDALRDMSATAAEMARITHRAVTSESDAMARDINKAMLIAEANMRTGGQRSAAAIAEELGIGVADVKRIAADYGITLADSINPILSATGKPQIQRPTRDPDAYSGYAAGGYVDGPNVDRDVVPAMLMPGEVVIRKAMARRWGTDALLALNAGEVPTGWNIPGYAQGGRVTGDTQGLHPILLARLQAWSAQQGSTYNVGSGYRSIAEQQRLYQMYLNGTGNLAAVPGSSMHNYGLASDGNHWGGRGPGRFGLHYNVGGEPWHVEPIEAKKLRGGGISTHGLIPPVLPKPPSIGRWPVAQGGEGVMGKGYSGAKDWLASLSMYAPTPDLAGASGVKGIAQAALAARGWSAYWPQLDALVQRESSWNPRAQNPTSTAYGLFQFLNGTWGSVGGTKTSDPAQQIAYGLDYIAQRYGNPAKALAFHDKHNWYGQGGEVTVHGRTFDSGGTLAPGWNLLENATGRPEPVRPIEAPHQRSINVFQVHVGNDYLGQFVGRVADQRIEISAETDDRLVRMGSKNA